MNTPNPLKIIDDIVNLWSVIIVPFYINDPNSSHKAICLGSGFNVEKYGATFLVTALHVLKELNNNEALAAKIGGKGILLNGRPFIKSDEDDIAVAFIDPNWAKSQGITKTSPLSLNCLGRTGISLNIFVLLGFPGSKNKINFNTNETARQLLSYSSTQRIEQPRCKTHIRNPVAFKFDKRSAINADGKRINVGHLTAIAVALFLKFLAPLNKKILLHFMFV
ncbi:MAG: hypothetical protein R8K20_05050 [Gallionellaceae bacterium]